MLAVAQASKIPVVVSTLASNLRHWAPVETTAPSEPAPLPIWEEYLAQAENALKKEAYKEGIQALEKALTIRPENAKSHFLLAQCYDALRDYAKARSHYETAVEGDSMTWVRCRKVIDRIIRDAAANPRFQHVALADSAAAITNASPGGIPGAEFFVDSCHTNFEGSYLVSLEMLKALTPLLPIASPEEISSLADTAVCARYLGLTAQELSGLLQSVQDSIGAHSTSAAKIYGKRLDEVKEAARQESAESRKEGLEAGLEIVGIDYYRQAAYVEELENRGDMTAFLQEARVLVDAWPYQRKSYYLLGRALIRYGHRQQAGNAFKRVYQLYDDDVSSLAKAASTAALSGNHAEANTLYKRALKLDPQRDDLYQELAGVLLAQGQVDEALDLFWSSSQDSTMMLSSCRRLIEVYGEQGKLGYLEERWQKDIAAGVELGGAYIGLGALAQSRHHLEEAIAWYEKAMAEVEAPDILRMHLIGVNRQAAREALDNGDRESALRRCEKILALDEGNIIALALKAEALIAAGGDENYQVAREAYQQAIDKQPWDYALYEDLSELVLQQEGVEGLVAYWEKAREAHPKQLYTHYSLGLAYERSEAQEKAMAAYRKALSIDPQAPCAIVGLQRVSTAYATHLEASGRTEEARALSEEVLALKNTEENNQAHWIRSMASPENEAAMAEACGALRGAINNEPWNYPLYEKLSKLYLNRNDLDGLVQEWKSQVAAYPNRLLAHFNLGLAWERKKNLRAAVESYEAALALDENAQGTREALNRAMKKYAEKLGASGELQKALALCERAEALHFSDAAWSTIKSSVLYESNHPETASSVLIKDIIEHPESPHAYQALENFCARQNDMTGLATAYRELIAQDPQNPFLHYFLGQALLLLKDEAGARRAFEESLRLNPANREVQKAIANLALGEIEHLLLQSDQTTAKEKLAALPPFAQKEALFPILSLLAGTEAPSEADWEAHRTRIEAALAHDPGRSLYYEALLKLYWQQNQGAALCDYLARLATENPENAMALSYLAQAQEAAGNSEAAIEAYLKAFSLDAHAPKAQARLEALAPATLDHLLTAGRPEAVLRYAERLAPLAFLKAPVLKRTARAHTALKEEAAALKAWRDLIEVTPWDYEAYDALAAIYLAREDLAGLEQAWREMAEAHPDRLLAHYSLGLALERQGALKQALEAYRAAEALDPKAEGTQTAITRIENKLNAAE